MTAKTGEQFFKIFNKQESELQRLLNSFGVKVSSIDLVKEKFFEHYDIRLSPGTRSSKLDRLLPDIGLFLESRSTPSGSLIMDRGVYRLSVQRSPIESPSVESLTPYICKDYYCPIILGTSSDGSPLIKDLSKIPNILIAGTTGSGKSILLHSLTLSALYGGASVYISDPKMVEFDRYKGLSGVKGVYNSYEETSEAIDQLIQIMNERFSLLKRKGVRSAQDLYRSTGNKKTMNPICLIIDEWADLVLQNKEIQKKLCMLAQKGRAAGMSVILSTQRPSSSVISGLIKANFPGRIALRVASLVDSRVILDQAGAEKITDVGMGLFLGGRSSEATLFRAPNVVDIGAAMNTLGLKKSSKRTIWSRFGWA
jgi:S-DNA-T family DNA segregation ATPase FtsK/SpoIIIE